MEPLQNEVESAIAPLKKVTPLSKYLAMVLFVALPFLGGYIGYNLAPILTETAETTVTKQDKTESNPQSFISQVHFPETSRFNVKPSQESMSSFILRDDKGLSLYDVNTKLIKSISLYDIVPNLKLGDYTKVGNLVLFATGEGVGVYDLDTDKVQIYTTADGLADKSNIIFHPDPYDENIVWIGTFRGLSQFNLLSRTFKSYTSEMGISGTFWEPKVFYIDQNTVWVTVAANTYNDGGVARLDKATGLWTAWSTETFVVDGEVNDRVDPVFSSVGSERYIIIEEDNREYIFDREQQIWSVMRSFQQAEPIALGLNLNNDWYYYNKQDVLWGYNIITKQTFALDCIAIFNKAAGTDLKAIDISYDEANNRYLLQSHTDFNFVEKPYIVTFRVSDGMAEDVKLLTFADIYERYQYVDVEVLDAAGTEMVMKTRDTIVLYDFQQQRPVFTLDKTALQAKGFDIKAKLYPTVLVVHVAEYCDGMGCSDDSGYNATTTVWNRKTGQLELTDSFNSQTLGWGVSWDEESSGIILHNTYAGDNKSFILNPINKEYKEIEKLLKLSDKYIDYGEYVSLGSSGNIQYVKRNISSDRNILKVKIVSSDTAEETFQITLPMPVDAFGNSPGYEVADAVLNNDIVWFLTDRGLVKFNLGTKQWKIYTSADGLIQDSNNRLYISGNTFVISNNLGVVIYQYKE